MKNFYRYLATLTIIAALLISFSQVQAGNKARSGQPGPLNCLLILGLEAWVGEV